MKVSGHKSEQMSQRVLKPLRANVSVISPGYEQGDDIFCCVQG